MPLATLGPLQRVQNTAARLIFELTPRDHITPSLLQLHWLPVLWRIEYKLCCNSVHTGRCPAYLKNTVQLAVARLSRSDLRSSSTSAYLLQRLKTNFGERAFSHAGPSAWNALPTHVLTLTLSPFHVYVSAIGLQFFIAHIDIAVLSVRLSVCPSVCPSHAGVSRKRLNMLL